ncbi:TonB family protein [Acinetobacter seifertii]|uniref:TonB family protein n=1 Tax=Acinetobacter seifertii TaxID=1530123 RepID=UPI001C0AFC34|nr:energy transducer TonB [Acinetobacter seifertii]MBU3085431.1 energy transducer TonB [Acinetobacter seifertii]
MNSFPFIEKAPSNHKVWLRSTGIVVLVYASITGGLIYYFSRQPIVVVPPTNMSAAAPVVIEMAALPTAPKDVNNLNNDVKRSVQTIKPTPQPPVQKKEVPIITSKQPTKEPEISESKPQAKPFQKQRTEPVKERVPTKEQPEKNVQQQQQASNSAETTAKDDDKVKAPEIGANSQTQNKSNPQWESFVLAKLQKLKRYPAYAQRQKQEDVVMVQFTLDSEGKLINAHLLQSKGFELLDRESLALIKRASPFPKPPPEALQNGSAQLTVPIEFFIQ